MAKKKKSWVRFRHRVVHHLVFFPFLLVLLALYRYRARRFRCQPGDRPFLILSNHTTPLDPFCVGLSFGFPIYYVASDHLFRLSWVSRAIRYLVAPIPIVKSKMDLHTLRDMMTVLSEGGSVCLFPEGNRNYNGMSVEFTPAVAKLARKLRVPLLLYRLEGGYLTSPRWADSIRRGRLTGSVSRRVSVAEMEGMTVEALYDLIRSELDENAFDRQRRDPVRYRGSRPAQSLERALYLCPACRGMATLASRHDRLRCSCGFRVRYNEYGFFEADGTGEPPFRTMLDWDVWQSRYLSEWLRDHDARSGSHPLLWDDGQRLYACTRAGVNRLAAKGRFSLYRDRFRFEDGERSLEFPLAGIDRVIIHGKQTLQFTGGDGTTYEVRSPLPRSALKYLRLFHLLRNSGREVQHGFLGL